jgi:hypothetical protein
MVLTCCLIGGLAMCHVGAAETPSIPNFRAADPVPMPQQSIGFRGDGTGVIPGNNPPTDFDAFTGKNLRWKADLPGPGQRAHHR